MCKGPWLKHVWCVKDAKGGRCMCSREEGWGRQREVRGVGKGQNPEALRWNLELIPVIMEIPKEFFSFL